MADPACTKRWHGLALAALVLWALVAGGGWFYQRSKAKAAGVMRDRALSLCTPSE